MDYPIDRGQIVSPSTRSESPICVGMLGWDFTSIDGVKTKHYGGAVLHFITAAAILGIRFKILSYVNLSEWKKLLNGLNKLKIDTDGILNSSESIRFFLYYDKDLNYKSELFEEEIPSNAPNLISSLKNEVKKDRLIHVCPTTPDQDMEYLETIRSLHGCISTQLYPNNVLIAPEYYREALKFVDYLFMNEFEALVLSNKKDIKSAIEKLRSESKATIYITSESGVKVITKGDIFKCPSVKISPVDPTGAGDAFAGGCTAGRILTNQHTASIRLGVLCATAKLTNYSSHSLLALLNIFD